MPVERALPVANAVSSIHNELARLSDERVMRWAHSEDRWRRRLALVSTVALNSRARGGEGDATRTLTICRTLIADRDDMVVKALSWALRELAKRDPESVRHFMRREEANLASRVRREVASKLETGYKVRPRPKRPKMNHTGEDDAMKIGILGSGDVAKSLAKGFLAHGHEAMIGTRDPGKLKNWFEGNPKGSAGSFADTAQFGELLVLAVKGTVATEVLRAAGAGYLAGKTIIDATNPIAEAPPTNGVLKFFTSLDESLMERLQREFPDAHFVKAFNSVGNARMVNPKFDGGKPTMFICGNDASAKKSVAGILDQFGWEVADMGAAEGARAIEPLCMLWCIPGFLRQEWTHAFKLLK